MSKRPLGVWLICAYFAWTTMNALVGVSYAFLSQDPDAAWGRDYYLSMNGWQVTYVVFSAFIAISAAVSLFLMRRIAAPLFTGVFALGIVSAIWQVRSGWIADRGIEELGRQGVWIALGVGVALMAAIVAYVWWLLSKGRLA